MKPKQQNNPVLIGILGVAFLFILARIFKTLTGGADLPPPAKTSETVTSPVGTVGAVRANKTKTTIQPAVMIRRDPFNHPYLIQVAQLEASKLNKGGGSIGANKTGAIPDKQGRSRTQFGLPNVMPPTYNTQEILEGFAGKQPPKREGTGQGNALNPAIARSPNESTASRPNVPTKWRVTAILGGSHPAAIIEGSEMSPRTVSVGDELYGFRIAAIRSDEIVIASARAVLTLPLETQSETKDEKTNKTEANGMTASLPK